jgi:hypothetical protein
MDGCSIGGCGAVHIGLHGEIVGEARLVGGSSISGEVGAVEFLTFNL